MYTKPDELKQRSQCRKVLAMGPSKAWLWTEWRWRQEIYPPTIVRACLFQAQATGGGEPVASEKPSLLGQQEESWNPQLPVGSGLPRLPVPAHPADWTQRAGH